MITTEFLSSLDRFNLIIKKRVTSSYTGGRSSLIKGRGHVVTDHRIYAPGDDFRLIDWNVYARTDDLHVKLFEEEKELVVHILVDSSASMDYGSPNKFEYAAMLGAGFAYLAMKENEKFQFATFAETMQSFQASRGMSQLAKMVEYFNSIRPNGHSAFRDGLTHYRKALGTHSMVVVVSDFLMPLEEIEAGLYMLGQNDIKVIMVLDNREKNLEVHGDIKLKDSETGDLLHTYAGGGLKADYERRLNRHIASIQRICQELNADFSLVTTEKPIFDSFYHILREYEQV